MPRHCKKPSTRAKAEVGRNIYAKRKELGMSLLDVATLFDTSPDTIALWEKGNTLPRKRQTPKLIEFLGFDPYGVIDSK